MHSMARMMKMEAGKSTGKHQSRMNIMAAGEGHTVEHHMPAKLTHSRAHGIGREMSEPESTHFGKAEGHKMMNHIAKHLGIEGKWSGGGTKGDDGAREDEEAIDRGDSAEA